MRILIAAALTIGLAAAAVAEEAPAGTTLSGQYEWSGPGMTGGIAATFTPSGEGTWTVEFNFVFGGHDRVYSGTAEGSLDNGKLSGTVQNEEKKRTFTFTGTVSEGTFNGTHAETTGGVARDTGTMTLAP